MAKKSVRQKKNKNGKKDESIVVEIPSSFPPNPYRRIFQVGWLFVTIFFVSAIILSMGVRMEMWSRVWAYLYLPRNKQGFLVTKEVVRGYYAGIMLFLSIAVFFPTLWLRKQARALDEVIESLRGQRPLARFPFRGSDWFAQNKYITLKYLATLWACVFGSSVVTLFLEIFLYGSASGESMTILEHFFEIKDLLLVFGFLGILGTIYIVFRFYRLSRKDQEAILYKGVMILGSRWVLWCRCERFKMELVGVKLIHKDNPESDALQLTLESRRSLPTEEAWEDRVHFAIPLRTPEQRQDADRVVKLFQRGRL